METRLTSRFVTRSSQQRTRVLNGLLNETCLHCRKQDNSKEKVGEEREKR